MGELPHEDPLLVGPYVGGVGDAMTIHGSTFAELGRRLDDLPARAKRQSCGLRVLGRGGLVNWAIQDTSEKGLVVLHGGT